MPAEPHPRFAPCGGGVVFLSEWFGLEKKEGLHLLKSGIETRNQAFNSLIEQIEQVAIHSDRPILLTGPTGAG